MGVGPITLFDKSALESLSVDEALWFDTFYLANITPLFFVETLADLQKALKDGRTPEQVVGNLAEKTPVGGGMPNVPHAALALAELMGQRIKQTGFPVISGGRQVAAGGQRGFVFEPSATVQALERWQNGEFLAVERDFARRWREGLSGLNLRRIYERYRQPKGMKLKDLAAIKKVAEQLVTRPANYDLFRATFDSVGIPFPMRNPIEARWRSLGEPALSAFAPYVAHIMTVDLFFNFAIGSELIGRERPSNKIDMAYLYYLPFCMVFVSGDRLHARTASHFVRPDQLFLRAPDLKADLKKLDGHYAALPEAVRERGVMSFAHHPPEDTSFLATQLWDRFLPAWRENLEREVTLTPEREAELIAHLNRMTRAPADTSGTSLDIDEADFLSITRRVPIRRGKWRLLPPEVERDHRK